MGSSWTACSTSTKLFFFLPVENTPEDVITLFVCVCVCAFFSFFAYCSIAISFAQQKNV